MSEPEDKPVSTRPQPKTPPRPAAEWTPADFVAALETSLAQHFEGVRKDFAAQISALNTTLDQHANKEMSHLEAIGYSVDIIQKNVDTLTENYKNVNVRLTGHDDKIEKLERELEDLKKRADQMQADIRDLKLGQA